MKMITLEQCLSKASYVCCWLPDLRILIVQEYNQIIIIIIIIISSINNNNNNNNNNKTIKLYICLSQREHALAAV